MEQNQNQFKCSGDCLTCRVSPSERKTQWQYCAAQFSYNALRTMQAMQESINAVAGEVKELRAKVEAIQNSEAMVFAPDSEELSENSTEIGRIIGNIAQEGDGAAQ